MRALLLIAAAGLFACSPPASKAPETEAPAPPPVIEACNELAPDFGKMVSVEQEAAAALPSADLAGGPITPGTYDLTRAVRMGDATGWRGERAAVLVITEGEEGVTFNWASSTTPGAAVDAWTAHFADKPEPRLTYTCGRIGAVDAGFAAAPNALELRLQDGASGALQMSFARRAG